jgi:hypothetical protein
MGTAMPAAAPGESAPALAPALAAPPAGGDKEQSAPEKPGAQTQDANEPFGFTEHAPFG